MRPINRLLGYSLISAALLFWSGCGLSSETACCDCDHGHDGHVHAAAGVEPGVESSSVADCGHTHTGPNSGQLIVLGDDDYHAELLIDHARAEVTVRILDRTGRKPIGIEQSTITLNFKCQGRPHQIQLVAAECPEGSPSKSSCFTGTSELLRNECEVTGRLNVVIGGKPYTGRVAHRQEDHTLIR